ncbi:MAG: ATP-binding cassette domain-containing protein, partial [Desulfobacterales bacterium]|nr:ATP-binding cassette domain-containing protein [Desulfobacterales bacterium]
MGAGLRCHRLGLMRPGPSGTERAMLSGVEATFPAGAVTLVTGATGAGKSTLLHLLAGILRPTQGEVQADGRPVSRWLASHKDRWRREVGIVFQRAYFLPNLTVFENVLLPFIPRPGTLSTWRRQAHRALQALNVGHLAGERVSLLSGGERQRVAVARATVTGPRFLLADEPTAFQDGEGTRLIMFLLQKIKERGASVVLASHDPRVAAQPFAERHYHLEDGRLKVI